MKKLTLAALILFGLTILGIFVMSQLYPTVDSQTPTGVTFTLSEVASHSTQDDCYLTIDKKVYDVTAYFGKHPGGNQSILDRCGTEATGIFSQIHSNFAWDLLGGYYIGDLTQ